MQRNILIAYILTFLRNSWFWLGIWVFYYLRFTNYAGIGIIEAVMMVASTAGEIPTGVIADFFGKKKTLTIGFFLQAMAMFLQAFFPYLQWQIFAIFILGVGGSFYSGTLDALVYDSLKELQKEKTFDKVISKITGISLIAPAVCGAIGGFLYIVRPNIPYVLTAIFYGVAMLSTIFLVEPKIKTKEEVSHNNFFEHIKQGFHELFKNTHVIEQTLLLIMTGAISIICLQVLNDFLGVEFGFKPTQLALVWSFLYIVCAGVSYLSPYIARFISYKTMALIVGLIIAITLIVSPLVGVGALIFGGITIGIRAIAQTLYENASSVLVNENTESKYRTTTLSTFNLLKNIPYALSAYFLGTLADKISSIRVAFFLGIILLCFILLQMVVFRKRN